MANALEVIQSHQTWDILDSSKLTTYMDCPRQFFYRYLLGWKPDYANNHLVFGSAWHLALEHMLLNNMDPQAVPDATIQFLEYYREHFPASTDELYEPKTPTNALNSLVRYVTKFQSERHYTVVCTELAGLVLIDADRTMVFKCDAIISRPELNLVYALDFKTSQRKYGNWGDHWTMSTQMLTYLHALHCLYPQSDTLEMLVRCAFFYKKSPTEFEDHPIRKTVPQMQAWLSRVNSWADRLEDDMDILARENTDDSVLQAFPQNDRACFNFGRQCEFFDFCNAWANPLTRCDQVPIGFVQEFWDPLDRPEIRQTVDLAHPTTCEHCNHTLIDNQHGFDQSDMTISDELTLIHNGTCTYCKYCRGEAG